MKPLNVLSLFDGISCCQTALKKLKIPINLYFASEVEPSSILVTQKNYPNTVQVGDVRKLTLKYFEDRDIKIDMITAGSPCQDLSFSNTRGKGLNGNSSNLFYQFTRLIEELRPSIVLLENVKMKDVWRDIMTFEINKSCQIAGINSNIQPQLINSNLFSAQNRPRLYWTNLQIPNLPTQESPIVFNNIVFDSTYKIFKADPIVTKTKETNKKGTIIQWDSNGKEWKSQWDRAYFPYNKLCTLTKQGSGNTNICVNYNDDLYRKLHPIEAERLQSLDDYYTDVDGIPESKRFQMLGNAWNVDTICFVLSGLKDYLQTLVAIPEI